MIAEELLKTEYDAARLVFNRFQSAIAFKPTITTVLSPDALEKEMEAGGNLDQYEVEGPDRAELLQDLGEFQLATVRLSLSTDSSSVLPASRRVPAGVWPTTCLAMHLGSTLRSVQAASRPACRYGNAGSLAMLRYTGKCNPASEVA